LKYHRVGLATSATGHDFSLAARKFHLAAWFDVIVTGADTLQHKPHPEPYLKALSGLGIGADQTLVIEDSPNGIRSARAAGCSVAAITTSFGAHELTEAGAGLLAPTFEELGVALALW
jgi:HAD superfamily hydrolase (TIGR01509 family)